jgi:hypothetical protein
MIHPPKQGESQSESFGNPGDSGFARNALVFNGKRAAWIALEMPPRSTFLRIRSAS